MNCTQPGAVTFTDLIAYVANEATPSVVEHVQACPSCLADARTYTRGERRLRHVLDRVDCPPPELVGAYQLDFLPLAERQRIAAHLILCPRCVEERRSLRAFLADEPPPVESGVGVLTRIVAALVPAPIRTARITRGKTDTTSSTYRALDLTIALRSDVDPWHRRAVLVGLVLAEGDGDEGLPVGEALLAPRDPAGPSSKTTIDETGFVFEEIATGAYRLELYLGERLIVIEDLEIG